MRRNGHNVPEVGTGLLLYLGTRGPSGELPEVSAQAASHGVRSRQSD